jgi:WbqC-like protein family
MRTVVISQPTYLPWTGYFRIMKEADVYVFLDNVQFEQRSWQSRNRIKSVKEFSWLTIPTHHTSQSRICDVEIDNSKEWMRQHFTAIKTSYGKALYFGDYYPFFKSVYETDWTKLALLNIYLIKYFAKQLGLSPIFVKASKLSMEGKRTNLLLDICKMFGADRYVSSIGAKNYMEEDGAKSIFEKEGIAVEFLEVNLPKYPQLFGEFVPELSVVDLVFNCGPDSSKILFGENTAIFSKLDR